MEGSREEKILQKRYDAILYLDFNKPVESMELFKECIDLDDANIETYNELGLVFHSRLKNYEEALSCYVKALSLDDSLFFIHYQYALTLQRMGKEDEACKAYMNVIASDGDSYFIVRSYLALIDIYIGLDDMEEEIENLYERACAVIPEYFLPYYHKALWFFRKGAYMRALECVQYSLAYNAYFTKAQYLTSILYMHMEEWEDALAYARTAMQYSEGHPIYATWYAQLYDVHSAYVAYTKCGVTALSDFLCALYAIQAYDIMERIVQEYQSITDTCEPVVYKALQKANIAIALQRYSYEEALQSMELLAVLVYDTNEYIEMLCLQASIYRAMQAYINEAQCYAECYSLTTEEQGHYAYKTADAYQRAEQYNEAIMWIHQAHIAQPKQYEILYEYIVLLFSHNMIQEGLNGIELLRTYPIENEDIVHYCVQILYVNKFYRECIRWCELWKNYNPGNYLAYYYCACSRYARQYLHDAVENARIACLLSPSNIICNDAYIMMKREMCLMQIDDAQEDTHL